MKYLNLSMLYYTYMRTPLRNILSIINLVTFCLKLFVWKPNIIYLSETWVLAYISVHISKLRWLKTWKVLIGHYFTTDNHFQKCWDTSRFSLKYCNTTIPLALYSMLGRNCHIFVLAIDIQTSNSTLNGGGGRGRSNSWHVNCGKAECNVKPYVSQVLLKVIVSPEVAVKSTFKKIRI